MLWPFQQCPMHLFVQGGEVAAISKIVGFFVELGGCYYLHTCPVMRTLSWLWQFLVS